MKWFLLFAFPLLAFGQQRTLTVEVAVQLTLENNKTLHSSWSRVEAADARWSELNASRFPALKLQGAYIRLSDVDPFAVQVPFTNPPTLVTLSPVVLNTYSVKLSLQQPLFTGFRLSNTISTAEYLASATHHDYLKDKAELIYATKAAYWNLFKAMEVKRVVSENVELTQAHRADIEQALRQGIATRNDLLKVEVQLSNSRLLEIDAANAVKLAMMGLNNLIGLPLETEIQLTSVLPDAVAGAALSDSLSQFIQHALRSRPEITAMEFRLRASESSVTASRGGWYPQIALAGNYYYVRPHPRVLPTKDEFKDTWDIGVSVSFDVWNWGTTVHQTTQAEAAHVQTQNARAQLRDAITLEVTQNYLEVITAKEKLTVASGGVEQAEESYRITKSKFEAGLATNTDLLDAEVALLQAKTQYVAAAVDYELAGAKLTKSIGKSEVQ